MSPEKTSQTLEFLSYVSNPPMANLFVLSNALNNPLSGLIAYPDTAEVPARAGILTSSLNGKVTSRNLYGYVWARIASPVTTDSMVPRFWCQINLFNGGTLVKRLPLRYQFGNVIEDNLLPAPPDAGLSGDLARSSVTAPIAGGVAAQNVLGLSLFRAITTAANANPEPTDPILLQPYRIDFLCDKITVDVVGWSPVLIDPRYVRILVHIDDL